MEQVVQSFSVQRSAHEALDAAEEFLDGSGTVVPPLRGRLDRRDDHLAVHHGRVKTTIRAEDTPAGCDVTVSRSGQAPLERTRHWILGVGLAGFLLAWGLTVYNDSPDSGVAPLTRMVLLLLGTVASLAVLFVADRSLERRSSSFVLALEDAMAGDPLQVLRDEVDALERSTALANGFLVYCGALLIEFVIFVLILSDTITEGVNRAVAIDVMRTVFLLPIVPSLAFAGGYFAYVNRIHAERLARVEAQWAPQ